MGKVHQKIWAAEGAKELIFLRQETKSERGSARTDVTDIKEGPQPESLFEVPKGFTKFEPPARPH